MNCIFFVRTEAGFFPVFSSPSAFLSSSHSFARRFPIVFIRATAMVARFGQKLPHGVIIHQSCKLYIMLANIEVA
jgi:hypothetical protein